MPEPSPTAQPVAPWLRREGESAKAYYAFTLYRDMDPKERSIDAAFAAYTGQEKGKKSAAGHFTRWSAEHDWKARAEAYDAHREAERLAARGTEEIEAFRERQRQLAAATTATAVRMLQKLNQRLEALDASEITPQMIPSYARAVAAVAEASTNAEATANGVAALLADMEARAGGGAHHG